MRARSPFASVATILAEGFLGRLTFGMVTFALPLYAHGLGISLAIIGVLVSMRSVVELVLKPPAGWLADRIGVRRTYLGGVFARVLAAAALILPGGIFTLALVRILQGVSGAGRDVASLGVIVRDAEARVGVAYGWLTSLRQVGNVAGASVAGLGLAASGGSFRPLFLLVAGLSVLPVAVVWFGLREVPDAGISGRKNVTPGDAPSQQTETAEARTTGSLSALRDLMGPASVGTLVTTSAYMVHGIFPILATEYAGLSAAQAGIIYSLSAAVFLVAAPVFGWAIDRHGRLVGIAWRSAANVGSSLLYLAFPTFLGLAAARSVDDSGKAAFRPAWASAMTSIAARDPVRSNRRLGVLDASQSLGEAIGPALAGMLWQTGGIFALFGARIVIAAVAEVTALRVFGELRAAHLPWRSSPHTDPAEHPGEKHVR